MIFVTLLPLVLVVAVQLQPTISHPEPGAVYLSQLHERACAELDAEKVASHIDKTQLVCALADARLTQVLPLVEHAWPKELMKNTLHERNRLLNILTTQGETAFAWKQRGDNHDGLFQITRSTYYRLRPRYPDAKLPEKHFDCVQNHVCSTKFQLLIHDANAAQLQHRLSFQARGRMPVGSREHALFLAAAYNWGNGAQRAVRHVDAMPHWRRGIPGRVRGYLYRTELLLDALAKNQT